MTPVWAVVFAWFFGFVMGSLAVLICGSLSAVVLILESETAMERLRGFVRAGEISGRPDDSEYDGCTYIA